MPCSTRSSRRTAPSFAAPPADRDYFYYVGYTRAADGGAAGRQYSKYVGPADDPAIVAQVEGFGTIKSGHRERRDIVRALRGAGLSIPPRFVGEVVEALWKAGVFRLRGVLIGTAAFQTYEASMGVRFPTAPTMTGDVDIAQFRSISIAVDDATDPLLDSLRAIDPSFVPSPHQTHRSRVVAFRNAKDFRVEFLSPHTGGAEQAREPFTMPSLNEAAAQPLRYLDFLIHRAGEVGPPPRRGHTRARALARPVRRPQDGCFTAAGAAVGRQGAERSPTSVPAD